MHGLYMRPRHWKRCCWHARSWRVAAAAELDAAPGCVLPLTGTNSGLKVWVSARKRTLTQEAARTREERRFGLGSPNILTIMV